MQSLPNGLYASRLDSEKIAKIWEETQIKDLLGIKDLHLFAQWISSPGTVVFESSFGYIMFYNMVPVTRCELITSFYDGKLSEHTELVQAAIRWIMTNLQIKRVAMILPSYAHALLRWCRSKLGFTKEGVMRAYRDGKSFVVMSLVEAN